MKKLTLYNVEVFCKNTKKRVWEYQSTNSVIRLVDTLLTSGYPELRDDEIITSSVEKITIERLEEHEQNTS